MAFLHCHTPDCHWSQDDFWDETGQGYTPFRKDIIAWWMECLFKDKVYMDKYICEEVAQCLGQHGPTLYDEEDGCKKYYISGTDLVAFELKNKSESISNMQVKTAAEWKKVRDTWTCPWCGYRNWDID